MLYECDSDPFGRSIDHRRGGQIRSYSVIIIVPCKHSMGGIMIERKGIFRRGFDAYMASLRGLSYNGAPIFYEGKNGTKNNN